MKKVIFAMLLLSSGVTSADIKGWNFVYDIKNLFGLHSGECRNEPDENEVVLCTSKVTGKIYYMYEGKFHSNYPVKD